MELLESLKRIFPGMICSCFSTATRAADAEANWLSYNYSGVRGRILDLCKPTQRKYDLVLSRIAALGPENTALVCTGTT